MSQFTDLTPFRPLISLVRQQAPLVHCITNTVTICDCANLLLAAGASPTMAHHPEEVAEITAGCRALVCNLGAMDDFDAMLAAAPVAAKLGHPIVVDPVGCGGSTCRRQRFRQLAEAAQLTCIRGNASEIRALARDAATVTGVDGKRIEAEDDFLLLEAEAKALAGRYHCMVIASGPVDLVTDDNRTIQVSAGHPMMTRITGCGCMSSALLGAYLAVENSLESAAAACSAMGYCGEVAAARTIAEGRGTMTFHGWLIDEMSLLQADADQIY